MTTFLHPRRIRRGNRAQDRATMRGRGRKATRPKPVMLVCKRCKLTFLGSSSARCQCQAMLLSVGRRV